MIDPVSQPVAWSQLLYELEDAHEHLGNLISELASAGRQSDEEFAINLGHVYAHLNRAWHCRNQVTQISDEQWPLFSAFPADLTPVG
jgi:hypothetical protein